MATAMTIERFLGQRRAPYNLVAHQRTGTSLQSARDDSLRSAAEVYFEAGDHEHLVHLRTQDYLQLMAEGMHGTFSEPLFLQ